MARLKKFRQWDPQRQKRLLGYLGSSSDTPEEFFALPRGQQRKRLARATTRRQRANDPNAFTAPLTERSANRLAGQSTQLAYGGAMDELEQRQANIAPWFANYQQDLAALSGQAMAQSAPIIQQSQQRAQAAGQVTPLGPGVDPNSQQATDAALAAASREAMQNAFTTMLQGQTQATQDYFGGRSALAGREQISAQTDVSRERQGLRKEMGAYRATEKGRLRDQAHTQNLERAAFGLDQYEAETERRQDRRQARQEGDEFKAKYGVSRQRWRKMDPAQRLDWKKRWTRAGQTPPKDKFTDHYGYDEKQWREMTPAERRRAKAQWDDAGEGGSGNGGMTPTQRRAARKERAKAITRVNEVNDLWGQYKDYTIPDLNRKPTTNEIMGYLRADGYSQAEIRLARKVATGGKLTSSERAAARRLGIYPIPKRWKQGSGGGAHEGPH